MKKPSKRQLKELAALARLPDSKIDLSDALELPNWTNAVLGKFYRPIKRSTKPISHRSRKKVLPLTATMA